MSFASPSPLSRRNAPKTPAGSEKMTAKELVAKLDHAFSHFDGIAAQHDLEKLKTIGDAYMCAGGIPAASETHAVDAVRAAWAMQAWMEEVARDRE